MSKNQQSTSYSSKVIAVFPSLKFGGKNSGPKGATIVPPKSVVKYGKSKHRRTMRTKAWDSHNDYLNHGVVRFLFSIIQNRREFNQYEYHKTPKFVQKGGFLVNTPIYRLANSTYCSKTIVTQYLLMEVIYYWKCDKQWNVYIHF